MKAGALFTTSGNNAVRTCKYLLAFEKVMVGNCLTLQIESLSSCKKPVSNYQSYGVKTFT